MSARPVSGPSVEEFVQVPHPLLAGWICVWLSLGSWLTLHWIGFLRSIKEKNESATPGVSQPGCSTEEMRDHFISGPVMFKLKWTTKVESRA